MTIHIITKIPVDMNGGEFTVSCSPNSITIARFGGDDTLSLSLENIAGYRGGAVVHWSPVYGFLTSSADDLINDKDLCAYLGYARNVEKNVAALVLNKAGTDAAAVFYAPISYVGEVVMSEKTCSTAEAVELVFPGSLERRMRFRNAKIDLLRKIGSHDSLSALEKQVDLLSKLVTDLAELVPGADGIALVGKVRQMLEQAGSNTGKTDDEVVEKIIQFKGFMRDSQVEYFAQRDGAV